MSDNKETPYQCYRTYLTVNPGMWAVPSKRREKVTVLATSGEVAFIKKGRDKAKCCDISQLGKPLTTKKP